MRTSASHPIRVDFLRREACALRGRIGLTLAPGKKDVRGEWDRDLEADVQRLREVYGASLLVCLLEDHELSLLANDDLFGVLQRFGIRAQRIPIRDGFVPASMAEVVSVVRTVLAVARAGDNVVIHCRGGLARAGTIGACCLVALGTRAHKAIAVVREIRPGAIENAQQEAFVERFAAAWEEAPAETPSTSRFIGCLVGGALGDALGYPVEFARTAREIERVLGDVVPEHLPHAPGARALVSDDTQMTLFTAEGLIRARQRMLDRGICSTAAVLGNAYVRWLSTQMGTGAERWSDPLTRGWLLDVKELHARRAPGNTCLSALRHAEATESFASVDAPPNDSKGCGAVMRSAPIGLAAATPEEAFETARDAAALTHGHPSGYLAAAYFAAVIHHVARDVSLAAAMSRADVLLRREERTEEVGRAIDATRRCAERGAPSKGELEQLGGGWAAEEALAMALACALTVEGAAPESVASALWRAVAHGGDSDSTGSLTGNLLGAMFGAESLPPAWVGDVELRDVVERVALDLHTTFVLDVEPDASRYPPN